MFGVGECVCNGQADFIHKCRQRFKLGERTQEDKKNVNKAFPKVDQVKECQDDGTFFSTHEKIGIVGRHPCPHGNVDDLVDVCP